MNQKQQTPPIPDVVILLGTDASGKDHVANVLEKMIRECGGDVERRKRFFSGSVTHERTSVNKGFWDRLQERSFLAVYPYMGFLLPLLLNWVIQYDLWRFRPPKNKKLVIIGHNGLRALAFYWGRTEETARTFHVPDYLRKTFDAVRGRINAHVVVLDVDHHIRRRRIQARSRQGVSDLFDLYMLEDPARSERIEGCLVRGAQQLLGAISMINNDLEEHEICHNLVQGFRGVVLHGKERH